MISHYFKTLTPFTQGNILIVTGTVLLLNVLGVAGLNVVVILLSLACIWGGLTEAGYVRLLMDMINKNRGQ